MFRQILCPLDFSPTSRGALDVARALTARLDAELVVCHALSPASAVATEHELADVRHQLEAVLPAGERERARRIVHPGAPGPVIAWLAQETKSDLIVMGTHGHTGLLHRLFGGTTEYVIGHARVPVLAVPLRTADEPLLEEPVGVPIPAPRFM